MTPFRFRVRTTACGLLGAAALLAACRSSLPSLVDRLPATALTPQEWTELERRWDASPPPSVQPEGDPESPIERCRIRAQIVSSVRREEASRVDATLGDPDAKFVLRLRVVESLDGPFPLEELFVAVRSPMEQFAYPVVEGTVFTFTLERRSRGNLVWSALDVSPSGEELLERARQERRGERNPEAEKEG